MTHHRVLSLAAAILIACDDFRAADPGVDINVTREGSDYLFSFRTCRGDRIGVPWLSVTEAGGGRMPAYCELSTRDANIVPMSGSWKYGELPSGYEMKTCKALAAGGTYEVQVVGAGGGRRVFFVSPDGSIELREGTCSTKPHPSWWKRIVGGVSENWCKLTSRAT
jgi:hypothetical protein